MNKGLSRFEPCAGLEDRVLSKCFCLIEFFKFMVRVINFRPTLPNNFKLRH